MASDRMFKPNDEQLELLKRWYAPEVSSTVTKQNTNAFGMTPDDIAKMNQTADIEAITEPTDTEATSEDILDSETVTAQELASIRETAQQEGYDEGFSKGQEKGILSGHDEGYQQGIEQGESEGQQQAYDESKIEIEQKLAILNQLIEQFQTPLLAQEEAIEQALLALAIGVAEKIVHTEVQQNTQPIVTAVSEGLRLIGNKEPVSLRLNEQDVDAIEQLWDKEQLNKRNVTIEADPTIALGSCDIVTDNSSVTMDLNSRIQQVFDDFYSQPKPELDSTIESEPS